MTNIDAYRRYATCAANGLTQAETARRLGVSRAAVSIWAKRHPEVKFFRHLTLTEIDEMEGGA